MSGGSHMGRLKELLKSRAAKICLILLAAILLLLALWRVFAPSQEQSAYRPTEQESRLMTLLEEIEGIDSATAMITQEGGRAVSAVVIFKGKDSIITRDRLINITAAALGISKEKIGIFPA